MCSISGTCGCNGGTGTFLLALIGRSLWELVKLLARAARLLFVALLAVTVWVSPRAWRLARRGYREVRRRYALRPVLLDAREPVAAVTATTTAPTLADLKLKQEANA
ncbi:hypothetical protein [Micromonospora sp. NBRC 107095]|uniref:hypothetical protein n=1 Tax=Micromonospora sp. NBRC 107095 TaxID=3032209 RepID=UPI0024A5A720|nr:hypothetical protein [Micromonospora sp. NBRC 107095]GLZ62898.1 hypothetical protein Misp05_64740 [Micromonospora sp. NBRC 107095]